MSVWPYESQSLELPHQKKNKKYKEALDRLKQVIDIQVSRENAFINALKIPELYKNQPVISVSEVIANAGGAELSKELEALNNLINNTTQSGIPEEILGQTIEGNSIPASLQTQLYSLVRDEIIDIILRNKKDTNIVTLENKIFTEIYQYYHKLLELAKTNSKSANFIKIIEKSFSKILAIFSKLPQELLDFEERKTFSSYKVLNPVANIEKTREEYLAELSAENLTIGAASKEKIIFYNKGTPVYELNIEAIITSVRSSISGILNNLRGTSLEEKIAQAFKNGSEGGQKTGNIKIYGGTLTFSPTIKGSKKNRMSKETKKAYQDQLQNLLQYSLKYGRNIKADTVVTIDDQQFGISAKAGQKNSIKIDTRGSFYSFINFISQYEDGAPIAEALVQPHNIAAILGEMGADGNGFTSPELNAALGVIVYSFFGFYDENFIVGDYSYFFSNNPEITQAYQNNTVIITDEGLIKRISPYLQRIYDVLNSDWTEAENLALGMSSSFSIEDKERDLSEYRRAGFGGNALAAINYVSVSTRLSK